MVIHGQVYFVYTVQAHFILGCADSKTYHKLKQSNKTGMHEQYFLLEQNT